MVLFVFAITSFVFIHRQKTARQQLEMNDALLKARIEVQELALQSVSMEIHDNIGQTLSMARMMLTNGMPKPGIPANVAMLNEAAKMMSGAIDGLRTLAHTLNAKTVEQHGLIAAIEKELNYIATLYKLKCRFRHPGTELPAFSDTESIFLFRIVQESLQNIVRHAKAGSVNICMEMKQDIFTLSIYDNGIGIGKLESINSGLGLIGMHERAKLLGATLEIHTAPDFGSEILLTKQIKNNEN